MMHGQKTIKLRISVNKLTGPYCLVYILCLINLCFTIIKLAKNETIFSPIPVHTVTVQHKWAARLRQEFASRRGEKKKEKEKESLGLFIGDS
jgi:hypothetical protein